MAAFFFCVCVFLIFSPDFYYSVDECCVWLHPSNIWWPSILKLVRQYSLRKLQNVMEKEINGVCWNKIGCCFKICVGPYLAGPVKAAVLLFESYTTTSDWIGNAVSFWGESTNTPVSGNFSTFLKIIFIFFPTSRREMMPILSLIFSALFILFGTVIIQAFRWVLNQMQSVEWVCRNLTS